jgi:hypothetical protein
LIPLNKYPGLRDQAFQADLPLCQAFRVPPILAVSRQFSRFRATTASRAGGSPPGNPFPDEEDRTRASIDGAFAAHTVSVAIRICQMVAISFPEAAIARSDR